MAVIQLKRPLAPDHVPGPLAVCPLLPDQQRADDLETMGWAHPGLLPSTLPITARLNATWYEPCRHSTDVLFSTVRGSHLSLDSVADLLAKHVAVAYQS